MNGTDGTPIPEPAMPRLRVLARRTAAGLLLALAYPDRVARARGREGEFVMASGRAGRLDPASPLARETYLVIADLAGGSNARSRRRWSTVAGG